MKLTKKQAIAELSKIKERASELEAIINAPEITAEQIFWQLCEGLVMKIDREKYPTSTFFFKCEECWFEYDAENGYLWCRYKHVWSVFEQEFSMSYNDIQQLIKKLVEEHFKCKGITPSTNQGVYMFTVEEHFKCKGITPDKK